MEKSYIQNKKVEKKASEISFNYTQELRNLDNELLNKLQQRTADENFSHK